jgi:curved DNA-binding protein CbpA
MAINLYDVLGVSNTASQPEISASFSTKRQQLQDELDGGNESVKEKMWALKHAYDTLANPVKRRAYDESLRPSVASSYVQVPQQPEGMSWKTTIILVALIGSGLIGFGLNLGRSSKKDEASVQVLKTNRVADNDATRASTERILVEGAVRNEEKAIESRGQIANRIVSVHESAESRASRELEYRANAGAEILRQEQDRLKMADEQLRFERKMAEQEQSARQSQARVESDRRQTIQLMLSNGKLFEARNYARTPQELAAVSAAERANCLATSNRRSSC